MSSDAARACQVLCYLKAGGLFTYGWTFPDGTRCQTGLKQAEHRTSFCLSGRCQVSFTSVLHCCCRHLNEIFNFRNLIARTNQVARCTSSPAARRTRTWPWTTIRSTAITSPSKNPNGRCNTLRSPNVTRPIPQCWPRPSTTLTGRHLAARDPTKLHPTASPSLTYRMPNLLWCPNATIQPKLTLRLR